MKRGTLAATLALLTAHLRSISGEERCLTLEERDSGMTHSLTINEDSGTFNPLHSRRSAALSRLQRRVGFSVSDGDLLFDKEKIGDANEILAEAGFVGGRIVVARDEYNSWGGVQHVFRALLGHPVQVNQIFVVLLKDDGVTRRVEFIARENSYSWDATISECQR